jgi:translation initiation factor eIF-2B subunit delta
MPEGEMSPHPEIKSLIDRFQRLELHAAHSGRELMKALVQLVSESAVDSPDLLIGEVYAALDDLLPSMPAYAPPVNVLHRFLSEIESARQRGLSVGEVKRLLAELGEEHLRWSRTAREKIVSLANELIPEGAAICTFTLSETVMTTLKQVWENGKRFRVYVTESRPNNDGLETARRLSGMGVPVSVSIDACLPGLLARSELMLSGAEAIMMDGSAICKVGTYLGALAAHEYGLPLYILADTMKLDGTTRWGIEHPLDPLTRTDFPDLMDNGEVEIVGHLFDRTPAKLIRSVVTERGIMSPTACTDLMSRVRMSEVLLEKLKARIS